MELFSRVPSKALATALVVNSNSNSNSNSSSSSSSKSSSSSSSDNKSSSSLSSNFSSSASGEDYNSSNSSNSNSNSSNSNSSNSNVVEENDRLTFPSLGLTDYLCQNVKALGYKRPTDIQRSCIPAILSGRDVIGCAETGSGKTAAFALPILHELSKDIYGIFAVVLTPTRELAVQISEQFMAFGSSLCLRTALIIGGVNMLEQSKKLAQRPHVVIATPGRLRHHLEGADPPSLRKTKFLVLDECDRLLAAGFQSELDLIISRIGPDRQTLLFSATMTSSLMEIDKLALSNTLRFDLTLKNKTPQGLIQEYLFVPKEVKHAYLVTLLKNLQIKYLKENNDNDDDDDEGVDSKEKKVIKMFLEDKEKAKRRFNKSSKANKRGGGKADSNNSSNSIPFSIIIFIGACKRCQEMTEILQELEIDCVSLNSMMTQQARLDSLSRFKNRSSKILIATDVASRGLDIPSVDLVINFDLPPILSDYVHRVGRTARAGRGGRSISCITPNDIELIHAIEEFVGEQMTENKDVAETDIIKQLNPVAKAIRTAQQTLLESGFDERVEVFQKRKRVQKKQLLKKQKSKIDEKEEEK